MSSSSSSRSSSSSTRNGSADRRAKSHSARELDASTSVFNRNRELKNLRFINPGEANTLPVEKKICEDRVGVRRSSRHRKVVTSGDHTTDYVPHHDEEGYFVKADGQRVRLCDCLKISCPGCHFPCEKCGSRMCGPACQKNRFFIIESFCTESEPPRYRRHPYYNPVKREC